MSSQKENVPIPCGVELSIGDIEKSGYLRKLKVRFDLVGRGGGVTFLYYIVRNVLLDSRNALYVLWLLQFGVSFVVFVQQNQYREF